MKLSRDKVRISMIRKKMTIDDLAKTYGCSRSRIYVLLNSQLLLTLLYTSRLKKNSLNVAVTSLVKQSLIR